MKSYFKNMKTITKVDYATYLGVILAFLVVSVCQDSVASIPGVAEDKFHISGKIFACLVVEPLYITVRRKHIVLYDLICVFSSLYDQKHCQVPHKGDQGGVPLGNIFPVQCVAVAQLFLHPRVNPVFYIFHPVLFFFIFFHKLRYLPGLFYSLK